MATAVTVTDPAKAKQYFEAKMAFTTGPVELERVVDLAPDLEIPRLEIDARY